MFKFKIPMTIILSSGSLMLLVIASLLLASNAVRTSNIQSPNEHLNHQSVNSDKTVTKDSLASSNISSENAKDASRSVKSVNLGVRRRSGRVYSQASFGGQQQESYAAAYAAANSPTSNEQSSGLFQSTIQANDAINYASFGEPLPSSASGSSASSSSEARQIPGPDYVPHSNYYASYISPSSSASSYLSGQHSAASNYHSSPSVQYGDNHHQKAQALPQGYPTNGYERPLTSSYYDRSYLSPSPSSFWPLSSGGSGLMSSASSALSHWTSGITITEIICSLVAISIGAIILGAPFFLIYLALMGNFSGSGTLSLTNPSQTTPTTSGGTSATVNGRRKRLAIFEQLTDQQQRASEFGILADSVIRQLSPFVDLHKVSTTFKRLIDSMEKYSHTKYNATNKRENPPL